jgi:hypothetical protein
MALAHETVVFDVVDARVYLMTSDPTGASPVYTTGVDIPGIGEFSLEPNLTSAEIKGDSRVIAKRGRLDRFNWSLSYAKFSLNILDTILGSSTVYDTASTQATLAVAAPAALPYFRLEVQILDLDPGIGSLNIVLYKSILTGGSMFQTSSDNFGKPTLQGQAIAIDGTVTPPGGVATPNIILAASLNSVAQPLTN